METNGTVDQHHATAVSPAPGSKPQGRDHPPAAVACKTPSVFCRPGGGGGRGQVRLQGVPVPVHGFPRQTGPFASRLPHKKTGNRINCWPAVWGGCCGVPLEARSIPAVL